MCSVLEVSKSSYYSRRVHVPSKRQKENELLLGSIEEVHRESRGTYGSPRVKVELNEKGIVCGKNRVARIMRENGIRAKAKKRYRATTDSRHTYPVAENLTCKGRAKIF